MRGGEPFAAPMLMPRTPFVKTLHSRVLRYVRRGRVLRPGERVLVAVSGGQDSTALLLVLSALRDEMSCDIAVAHFDHGLRSRREAACDEAAVRALASDLGLPLAAGRGDVRARARRRHESIEMAARHLRFAFLRREARRFDATVIALGHTRDDRAETVLLHLLRGSGVDGLVGLRPRAPWPFGPRGPELARPLLDVSRDETLRYCRESGVEPREDPTNLLLDATRNRVRHELVPALRRFNPRLEEALCRLGDAVIASVDHLEGEADDAWRKLFATTGDAVTFPREAFAALSPALRQRLVRRAVRSLAGPAADVEAVHLAALEEALAKPRGRVSLAGGMTARVEVREVRIGRAVQRALEIPPTPLAIPGRTELPGWVASVEIVEPLPARPRPGTRFEAWLDADAVRAGLTVRSRRPGDRMRPLGLHGERKLQDILVDDKAPAEERPGVPVVCAAWGVAWVVGHRLDQRAALGHRSRRALRVRFRRAPGR